MRTTLDLDDDVLAAAKALAKAGNTTAGRIISDTMRRAIQSGLADPPGPTAGAHASGQAEPAPSAHGFVSITEPGQHIVTTEMVRALREELGE
jgi:hypothetical protein